MQKYNKTISFFNSTNEWGGGEKWHFDMAMALKKSGFNVLFFVNEGSELHQKLKLTNIQIITTTVTNLSFLNFIKINKIKNELIKNKVKIIIINLSRDLKFAGIAAKKAKLPHIIYRRGSAIPIKNTILNRFLFGKIVTDIIANTEATKKTILQNNSNLFNSDNIKVIYNGIDPDKLFLQETTSFYKKKATEIVIGNLGRLEKQKAQHYLLDIASELISREVTNFKIVIAGSGTLEKSLKERCNEMNLSSFVVFTGFAKEVKGFYEDIDIFALTSIWEGFGYVLAEAMTFGKPVVGFNISSNPEIIENNVTGYLVEFPNIKDFADKLIQLIKDENLRLNMGQKGKERVEKIFLFENKIKEFEAYISSLRVDN